MTPDDELRALAEKATPGPWYVAGDTAHDTEHRDSGLALVDTGRVNDYSIARLCEWPNATLLAACDPQTILSLLDRLEKAEREVVAFNEYGDAAGLARLIARADSAEADALALRAALEHIEEYWNGHEGTSAGDDAAREARATAQAALSGSHGKRAPR